MDFLLMLLALAAVAVGIVILVALRRHFAPAKLPRVRWQRRPVLRSWWRSDKGGETTIMVPTTDEGDAR